MSLILIAGPTGYGTTSLISQRVNELDGGKSIHFEKPVEYVYDQSPEQPQPDRFKIVIRLKTAKDE